nr:MAG TPA: hypothetical protein [Caudoviricetes sp.]
MPKTRPPSQNPFSFYPLFIWRPPTWKKFPSPVPRRSKKIFFDGGDNRKIQKLKN